MPLKSILKKKVMKEFSKEQKIKIIDEIISELKNDDDNHNFLCHIYRDVTNKKIFHYEILNYMKIEFPEFYNMIIRTNVLLYNRYARLRSKETITFKKAVENNDNMAWYTSVLKSYNNPDYSYKKKKLLDLKKKINERI